MAKKSENNLTQMQKNYLVKRINEIANAKIGILGGNANYGAPARHRYYNAHTSTGLVTDHNINAPVLLAIIEGKVKLRSKSSLMAELKSKADANKNKTYSISLPASVFIDLKSLEKFNKTKNAKIKADSKAIQKRVTAVGDEADKLKDSVMLNGSLAVEVLAKFEAKEF
jgi:hypothetical protein